MIMGPAVQPRRGRGNVTVVGSSRDGGRGDYCAFSLASYCRQSLVSCGQAVNVSEGQGCVIMGSLLRYHSPGSSI